ncbi:3119_t:CDS:2 [Entrophospora sp. SA101]|nr:3119_t:CDS:2 [Entrophospora sp. SA101]
MEDYYNVNVLSNNLVKKTESNKKLRAWEDDPEEEIPFDDSEITMAELCNKDMKRGRKSKTFKELELKKYQNSQQKRAIKSKKKNSSKDEDIPEQNTESITIDLIDTDLQIDEPINNLVRNSDSIKDKNDSSEIDQVDIEHLDQSENNYEENQEDGEEMMEINTIEEHYEDEEIHDDDEFSTNLREFYKDNEEYYNGEYTIRETRQPIRRNPVSDEGLELIEEDNFSHLVNSATYSKHPRRIERWSQEDTDLFFKALSLWGTDFEIISKKTFCGRKTRDQIKNKYKRERKNNLTKVNTALDTRIIG